ncbi:MAG: hypothetical protein NVS1B1_13880 [Candidatus Limnocylindrales bacterium]
MLAGAEIRMVIDVRQFPSSERAPLFAADRFAPALAEAGIGYVHLAGLAGRRRPDPGSPHTALRIPALRAFADHLTTDAFISDYARLREVATRSPTAILCSERLWWRCHRRLIADRLTLDGWTVTHQLGPKKDEPHRMWGAARVMDGRLVYDQSSAPDGSR